MKKIWKVALIAFTLFMPILRIPALRADDGDYDQCVYEFLGQGMDLQAAMNDCEIYLSEGSEILDL